MFWAHYAPQRGCLYPLERTLREWVRDTSCTLQGAEQVINARSWFQTIQPLGVHAEALSTRQKWAWEERVHGEPQAREEYNTGAMSPGSHSYALCYLCTRARVPPLNPPPLPVPPRPRSQLPQVVCPRDIHPTWTAWSHCPGFCFEAFASGLSLLDDA